MSVRVNIAKNFSEEGTRELPSESWLARPDVFLDERNNLFSYECNFEGWEWYYNYLKSNANFAFRNPKAYPTYLLDLGYIPVVFLPSCCSNRAVTMINTLDQKGIPYIKTGAYSFLLSKPQLDYMDAWVSKLDIERIFGIPIGSINSVDVVRRIYG